MGRRRALWLLSAFILAFLVSEIIATNELTRRDDEEQDTQVSGQRQGYCYDLLKDERHCPVERYPVGANFRLGTDDESLKKAMDVLQHKDLTYVCNEAKGYLGCILNMSTRAKNECRDVYESDSFYQYSVIYFYSQSKIFLATARKACQLFFNEMRRHFDCMTDLGLVLKGKSCAESAWDDNEFAECFKAEIDQTEICKTGAKKIFEKLMDVLSLESNKTMAEFSSE